jgi:hypothetical protein
MSGFTKLVSEIITSSIWSETDSVRIVWITILALKDADGFVAASYSGLANAARESVEDTRKAVAVLESPDPDSRSAEFDGRRIEKVDGGWIVLNSEKYRDKQRTETRRAYMREFMARKRAMLAEKTNKTLTDANPSVSVYASSSDSVVQEGVKGENSLPYTLKDCQAAAVSVGVPDSMAQEFYTYYAARGFILGTGQRIVSLPHALAGWKANQPSRGKSQGRHDPTLEQTIAQSNRIEEEIRKRKESIEAERRKKPQLVEEYVIPKEPKP